jgi:histidine triad (HIT) family protein
VVLMPGKPTDCIFCGIVKGKIKSSMVYQDSMATAFLDINPRNPGHTIVVSNNHHEAIFDLPGKEACAIFDAVRKVSIAIVDGTEADGVSISQSSGASAGQLVKHFHFHIIPRFSEEDAVSLEGILPIKNVSEAKRRQIVKRIMSNIPK